MPLEIVPDRSVAPEMELAELFDPNQSNQESSGAGKGCSSPALGSLVKKTSTHRPIKAYLRSPIVHS
jgi:hypothetical protein